MASDRKIGKVKMINQQKGFGFIRREDAHDLFFHVTECVSKDEFAQMDVGSEVHYDVGAGKRGEEGRSVELLIG